MLGPRFIPESPFYIQSAVMLSPRFIPESVFYTQSVVRSPQSGHADRAVYDGIKLKLTVARFNGSSFLLTTQLMKCPS